MEYDELKSIWEEYNNKLDNLERLNKKLIRETLLKKPKRKLNWHKFQSIYGLIAVPVILIIALHPNFKKDNFDYIFLMGCILILSVVVYYSYLNIKSYLILKQINFDTDKVLDSAIKINTFKKMYSSRWKHAIIYYPIIYIGVILIAWKNFNFDNNTIRALLLIFLVTYLANIFGPKIAKNKIQRLENDIVNLKEYID